MRTLVAIACALVAAACATPTDMTRTPPREQTVNNSTLLDTRWVGVVEPSLERNAAPRIEFTGPERVVGFTGCNMFSGKWSVEGGVTRLAGLATTKRMCMGPAGEIEERVLAALSAQSRVTRDGDRLIVTAPSGARFEFTRER
jgi:heat shock protein HslJ